MMKKSVSADAWGGWGVYALLLVSKFVWKRETRFSARGLRVVLPRHCHRPRLGFPFLRHLRRTFHHSLSDASSPACRW